MSQAPILIISPHLDFAQALSEQVVRSFGLECVVASDFSGQSAELVVAHEPIEGLNLPLVEAPVPQAPFKLSELLDQIEGKLPKVSPHEAIILGGQYHYHPRQKSLSRGESEVSVTLTDKEAQLLLCLASGDEDGVTREQLMKEVWGVDSALDTHTLETHIYRLRAKLRELGDDEAISATNAGYGLKIL